MPVYEGTRIRAGGYNAWQVETSYWASSSAVWSAASDPGSGIPPSAPHHSSKALCWPFPATSSWAGSPAIWAGSSSPRPTPTHTSGPPPSPPPAGSSGARRLRRTGAGHVAGSTGDPRPHAGNCPRFGQETQELGRIVADLQTAFAVARRAIERGNGPGIANTGDAGRTLMLAPDDLQERFGRINRLQQVLETTIDTTRQ